MTDAERADGQARTRPTRSEEEEGDVGRRLFIRHLATEVVHASATVVSAANALQQSSINAAAAILDPTSGMNAFLGTDSPAETRGLEEAGFPAAFRVEVDRIAFIDQPALPERFLEVQCRTAAEVALAIRGGVVGGALAIAQAAAYGLALTASRVCEMTPYMFRSTIRGGAKTLSALSTTAMALQWAIDRMLAVLDSIDEDDVAGSEVARMLHEEAEAINVEITRDLHSLADHGLRMLPLMPDRELMLLTHSSTGALACGKLGTALGVIRAIANSRRPVHVFVDETRPRLEGARLTAWELEQLGIPYTIIPDVAAASLLASGRVDAVLVGAERIAANGDITSTVGTYPLAVMAAQHRVPFHVCALLNSVDSGAETGAVVSVEEGAAADVTTIKGVRIVPTQARAWSPAFDVTPAAYVSAIITEIGPIRHPLPSALATAVMSKRKSDAMRAGSSNRARDI